MRRRTGHDHAPGLATARIGFEPFGWGTQHRTAVAAAKVKYAARAFSYATPGIRELFGSPETFMAMVKSSYPVVYRPRNVVFQKPTMTGSDLVQPVRMTDLRWPRLARDLPDAARRGWCLEN